MKSNLELVREKLEKSNWGYEVVYFPEYKDFISYKNVIKKKFIFNIKVKKVDFVITKENIKWESYTAIFLVFGREVKEEFYIFIDKTRKVILYR